MPDKLYYNNLYAFQDAILKIVRNQKVDFYLTGGTALSRCYLNHRYSDDLDFFCNQSPNFKYQAQQVVKALRQDNLKIEIGTASDTFLRITALKDQMHLTIDFVNDVDLHYGGFETANFFPKIDSWRNILSNKLSAMTRMEPKDVADTLFIAKKYPFEWPEIIEEAKSKDLWVNPLDISRIIKEFPVKLFDSIKWITSVDIKVLNIERLQMHDDIFYGRSNSLVE
jgi:predicted nucleotidyltransferase component of viral defense system